jgi:recombinational DNA repair protein RecR
MLLGSIIGVILFLIASFPLKNYLLLRKNLADKARWMKWLSERPSLTEYCEQHSQAASEIRCDYCGDQRRRPSLEMVIPNDVRYGIISNSYKGYMHFKSNFCSKCGSDLYREVYVD